MAELGALAYPVILAAMYGVFRVGRGERWGLFEWMRLGALAALSGFVVSIQVKLAMIGAMTSPLAAASALLSLGGMGSLLGLYIWENWQMRSGPSVAVENGPGQAAG